MGLEVQSWGQEEGRSTWQVPNEPLGTVVHFCGPRHPKAHRKVYKIHVDLCEGGTFVKIRKEVEFTSGQQQDRERVSLKHRAKNGDSE